MQTIIIGRRLVPSSQIAVIEPFDASTNPEFKPEKTYLSRIVMLNRDTILTEISTPAFAEANGFYLLSNENIAVNPTMAFSVETFTPTESFKPQKPYQSRIKWRDRDGNEQSKLLIMEPEAAVLELSKRGAVPPHDAKPVPRRPRRSRRRTRTAEVTAE